jgi:hypothetical protein
MGDKQESGAKTAIARRIVGQMHLTIRPSPRFALTPPLGPITLAPTHLHEQGMLEPNAPTKGGVRCHIRKLS